MCIEALSFMACMEILDPEGRCERVNEIAEVDVWINDLVALPFEFFKRIIGSLRRQGMKEKYVTPIIVLYASNWILFSKRSAEIDSNSASMLQSILDLLALRGRGSRAVPMGFYFTLLSKSIELGLGNDNKAKLQDQRATLLQFAQVEGYLYPEKRSSDSSSISSSEEVIVMEEIFHTPSTSGSLVAELWNYYLSHIVSDPKMEPKRFTELLETTPISWRQSHDQLYRAINSFHQAHQDLNHDEKAAVCKYLNCQKLSQEACVEAVQNDMLPLRLIVEILFIQ
ncbi:unnamed protein product [Linum tenue]|uniref:NPH3 domain-containing protein n=1 Tax=Linum tenue TaxID=586396 RepID=A0AAV0LD36_9ROSI|nr:unnamed protein product [Linum tenue]